MKYAARQSCGEDASLSRDASRCLEMPFPVFSNRHFPLKRQGKLGMQQSILNRYIYWVLPYYQYNVATRFTQVQQVSIRLYSEFVTDMSWTNCYHVNTEFNDNYCYWYLFQLFPSVNHANQFLYVYLDVKFASTKHYSYLLFGSFRIHEGNNYVYLSRYYLWGICHSLSAMFLRQFYYFVFYMKSLTNIVLQFCIAKTL